MFHTSETLILLADISASAGDSSPAISVTISGSSCRRESVRFHQAMNKVGTVRTAYISTRFEVLVTLTVEKNRVTECDALSSLIYTYPLIFRID